MRTNTNHSSSLLEFSSLHSPVIFYIAMPKKDWPLTYISENIEAITGHKVSSFDKDPLLIGKAVHPEDSRRARPTLKQLRTNGAFKSEFRLATASGDYRWFRDEGRLMETHGREEIVGCLVDISAEKDASSSLDEANELVLHVLEACPVPVRMTRLDDGEILYESPSSKVAYGGTPEKAPKMVLDHYVNRSDRQDYVDQLKRHGQVENYVVQFRRADGEHYPGSVSANLIDFRGEKVIVSTTLDLTEQRERENEIRRAQETLEDAIEALSEGFAFYDADGRLVMCNYKYREFNPTIKNDIEIGQHWSEYQRLAAERGQFPAADGRIGAWLKEREKLRKKFTENVEYRQSDGRWYSTSTHKTRQGGGSFSQSTTSPIIKSSRRHFAKASR